MKNNVVDIIKNFGCVHFGNTSKALSDLEEYHSYTVYGKLVDGRPHGFVWITHNIDFSSTYIPVRRHMAGLVYPDYRHNSDLEKETPILCCGVYYQEGSNILPVGEPNPSLLIEHDTKDRITFCGMQQDGLRHGLGSQFTYNKHGVSELQGIWITGILTYFMEDGRLIPLSSTNK